MAILANTVDCFYFKVVTNARKTVTACTGKNFLKTKLMYCAALQNSVGFPTIVYKKLYFKLSLIFIQKSYIGLNQHVLYNVHDSFQAGV